MNIQELIHAASWHTTEELMLRPLVQLDGIPTSEEQQVLEKTESGILTADATIVADCGNLDPRSIFLSASAPEKELLAAHRHCRYLAENPEEIRILDALVGLHLPEGYLEEIAIRVDPTGYRAFTPDNIQTFARLIRRTDNLAVRAIFLPFDLNGDLSRQAKDAFSLVKKIRSELPCMLHAFCFEGLMKPLMQGDTELLHTLRMLASLNDTSLYASFFIS